MTRIFAVLAVGMALAACGPSGPGENTQRASGACALVSAPEEVFGAGAQGVANNDIEGSAGSCSWMTGDGLRSGDLILYSAQSLGAVTPAAHMATLAQAWTDDGANVQPIEGLGEQAQIAADLPGGQVQVLLLKGETLALISATSGDEALTSEDLARHIAEAIAPTL